MIEKVKGKRKLPSMVVLVGSLLLIVTLFMPFASATGEYKETLSEYSDEIFVEELDMTNGDAVHISLFEYAKIYRKMADLEISKEVSITCIVIIFVFAFLAVLTLLFSIWKKPVAIMIFDVLTFAVFSLIKWDFKERRVIPSSSYDWGIAQCICYIGVCIVFAGAITLLVVKIKEKNQRKALEKVNEMEEL